jgi:hypothetical protein
VPDREDCILYESKIAALCDKMCGFYKQFLSTKLQEMSLKFVVRRLCQ